MIKELILEADKIIEKECNRLTEKYRSCESCKYKACIGYKTLCVIVEDLADGYKKE